jgi:hypothetical protein
MEIQRPDRGPHQDGEAHTGTRRRPPAARSRPDASRLDPHRYRPERARLRSRSVQLVPASGSASISDKRRSGPDNRPSPRRRSGVAIGSGPCAVPPGHRSPRRPRRSTRCPQVASSGRSCRLPAGNSRYRYLSRDGRELSVQFSQGRAFLPRERRHGRSLCSPKDTDMCVRGASSFWGARRSASRGATVVMAYGAPPQRSARRRRKGGARATLVVSATPPRIRVVAAAER